MRSKGILAAVVGGALVLGTAAVLNFRQEAPGPDREGGTVRASPAPSIQISPSRVDYVRLDLRISELMRHPDMVGVAVGTIEGGQVRFLRGYGEVLANSGVPVTPDTVFRWASLSKGVASSLIVKLAGDGVLTLDTPVANFSTTLSLPGGVQNVTVADLLSHRVGLVRNAWDGRLEAGEDPRFLRAGLGTLPAFCPPATCYTYQNIAYDTASEIVEGVTRRPYADVAREVLFAPLGMTTASIGRRGLTGSASWARPHRRGRIPTIVKENYYRVPAAGGVNSSIKDLTRWAQAQMGRAPKVLTGEMLDRLHRPRVATPPRGRRGRMDRALENAAYGLGWRSFTYAGHPLVGHRGSVDGYGSLILFDPAEQSGIVMLWNSNQSIPARLQLEFLDMLYGLPPTDWLELEAPPVNATEAATDVPALDPVP